MNSRQPTILIMAGGTGGHIFPGIAVAEALQKQGWKIHWLGTAKRMEASLIPQAGFDISFINIAGLRGKGWQSWLSAPFKLLHSVVQSWRVIKAVQPDVVLGMGGYASAPGGIAAWLSRTPLVLHEQNAVAGLSNRILARLASSVLSAFPGAFGQAMSYQVVGNPLRQSIVELESVSDKPAGSKRLLVVGGSLGAQVLNETVPTAISQIKLQNIDVWHQTGQGNQKRVFESYQSFGLPEEKIKVTDFIDNMAEAYAWADVVVCRAGALTVSELAMAAKPAIFIPLPHAVDDHQTKNAEYLVSRGAAKLIPQSEFNGTTLAQTINSMFVTEKTVQQMSKAAHDAAHADATVRVAAICKSMVK